MRLRQFNADLQRHVMRLTVDVGLRKSVLRALGKVLSSERHEELQLELMKSSAAPAQPTVIWACQLRKDYDFDEAFTFMCKCFSRSVGFP
eukprot:s14718_g1.t1